ncbi:MAG: UbiA family prenyltransferase [Candidatus Moranbacteria bacterium]|nr:UbiA family prenyltransferase [Candidatus Moranbacteria bacterium]MDD3964666.1 UbiA family prenyltransferase [Candidatus Moranbacteria bacterium]
MKKILRKIIQTIEDAPLTLTSFVVAFFALIVTRLLIETSFGLFQEHSFFFFFFEFTHTFFFFLCSFLLLVSLVRYAGNISFEKAANVLLFGFLIILTPPIIDNIIFHGSHFWSFYEFDGFIGLIKRFFTLFGDTPDMGITYGVRVEVVVVTLALALYTFLKSQSKKKAFIVALLTYTALFILGTFPAWLTLGILSFEKGFFAINQNDVAGLFLTPQYIFARDLTDFRSVLNVKMSMVYSVMSAFLVGLLLYREYTQYFFALLRNVRLPQVFYHGGLLVLGMILAFFLTETPFSIDFFHITGTITLIIAIESAWIASVIANDCFDMNIDTVTNSDRPLIQKTIPTELYKTMGILFFITSLLFAGIVSFSALLLLLGYQSIAWLYSAPPLRLKRFPFIATLFAGFAGILILITGFVVVAGASGLASLPMSILFYLFFAYTLVLPIKDFKDIAGDKKDFVYTIPVLLGAKKAQILLGSTTFLFYIFSTIILNARSLFFPALFFGSLAFWTIQKGEEKNTSFFSFRKLPGILVTLTLCYGITLTLLLF